MAHARRKYFDIFESTGSPLAQVAIERIGALYAIEEYIRGQLSDERRRVRQEHSFPLLNDMHRWLLATVREVSRKSDMAGAIHYSLARWEALCRFCHDGRIELDNNAAERAATMYSLIGTCKLNDINPEAYLRHVLERIADYPINRIEEVLPWNVASLISSSHRIAA
jgi:transposase